MYLLKQRRTGSTYMNIKKIMDSYKSYKRYSRKESIKKYLIYTLLKIIK